MQIKTEYKGKTIVKHTTIGNITVVVDNIDVSRYKYYVSIGMGYLFEPDSCIHYEAIEMDEQTDAAPVEPKPKRKRKTNAVSNAKRNQN